MASLSNHHTVSLGTSALTWVPECAKREEHEEFVGSSRIWSRLWVSPGPGFGSCPVEAPLPRGRASYLWPCSFPWLLHRPTGKAAPAPAAWPTPSFLPRPTAWGRGCKTCRPLPRWDEQAPSRVGACRVILPFLCCTSSLV